MERVLKEVPTAIESNDVQHNTPQYSYTALMIAAENGNLLFSFYLFLPSPTPPSLTTIFANVYCSTGYVEMVKMLIKRGAYCHYEFGYPRKTVVSVCKIRMRG